jgi:integrase
VVKVRQRPDGRYEARPRYQGRRYSVYGRTEAEVLSKLAELERQLALDQPPPANVTLGELLARWLAVEAPRWKPKTLAVYQALLQRWVLPELGRVRLSRLHPQRLERLITRIPGRQGSQVYRLLHRAFSVATRWGITPSNPLDRVAVPAYRPRRPGLPSADALARLAQTAHTDPWWPWLVVALTTGLRPGEQAALRWTDVDLERGVLAVRRAGQWLPKPWRWVEDQPKTAAGERLVTLPPLAMEAFRQQKRHVAELRLRAGSDWHYWPGGGLVFPNRTGGPLDPKTVRRGVRALFVRGGLQPVTLHQLRHLAASLLLQEGVPVPLVAQRLGHSTPAVTMAVYSHWLGQDRQAAEAVTRALGG